MEVPAALMYDEVEQLYNDEVLNTRRELQESSANLEQLAQYCEQSFLACQDQQAVFDQSKGYVVQSLVNVSHRLTKLSTSLSQLLNTHNGRLEHINHQLHCIQQDYQNIESYHSKEKVKSLGVTISIQRQHKVVQNKSINKDGKKHVRKPIDMSALDDIGHGVIVPDEPRPVPLYQSQNINNIVGREKMQREMSRENFSNSRSHMFNSSIKQNGMGPRGGGDYMSSGGYNNNGYMPQQLPPQQLPPQQMPPQQLPPQQMPPQQLPPQQLPPQQLPPQQLPPQQLPHQQLPPQQLPHQQFPPQQLPHQQFPPQQLPHQQLPPQQLPPQQLPHQQLPPQQQSHYNASSLDGRTLDRGMGMDRGVASLERNFDRAVTIDRSNMFDPRQQMMERHQMIGGTERISDRSSDRSSDQMSPSVHNQTTFNNWTPPQEDTRVRGVGYERSFSHGSGSHGSVHYDRSVSSDEYATQYPFPRRDSPHLQQQAAHPPQQPYSTQQFPPQHVTSQRSVTSQQQQPPAPFLAQQFHSAKSYGSRGSLDDSSCTSSSPSVQSYKTSNSRNNPEYDDGSSQRSTNDSGLGTWAQSDIQQDKISQPLSDIETVDSDASYIPPNYVKKVQAIYRYNKTSDDELSLPVGALVYVLQEHSDGWSEGYYNGNYGYFPANFTSLIVDK